ncbi:FtsX-like permease family protein [Streptomyces flavofungini]|uniref:FtsX-like permease family protein n=1 Tax=Streptomyces flavofungini TaxID=68200 RepID=UPI0034DF51E1
MTSAEPPPTGPSAWPRDLGLGMRLAVSGGREGWIRTLLTALGVGLGVAMLLGAASVPTLLREHNVRGDARQLGVGTTDRIKPGERTMLAVDASTEYRNHTVGGYVLRPEGARPPLPPGVDRVPGPGEMVVSPALKDLLESSEGRLLKERYDRRVVGTIGEAGLINPFELYVYAGSDTLTTDHESVSRLDHFGQHWLSPALDPVLIVLIVLACVVLLVPIAVFIATAVRFGGERRDKRLAALRLIGADAAMVRRIAAGEALFGTLVGMALGVAFFLLARQAVAHVEMWRLSAFPEDFFPVPALAVMVLLAVPVASVAVTVFALRSVTVEPLGVVRDGRVRSRRMWWRLPVPVIGVLLLLTAGAADAVGTQGVIQISAGITLTLTGLVLVLPWLVEAAVRRMRGGPVPWQLATRGLQSHSGAAGRAVAGITIAVAGGIALQMYTSGIDDDFTTRTGQDPSRAQLGASAAVSGGHPAQRVADAFRTTKGVKKAVVTVTTSASPAGAERGPDGTVPSLSFSVGSCASLRETAQLPSCSDGDVFRVTRSHDSGQDSALAELARPGTRLDLGDPIDLSSGTAEPVRWTLPRTARTVDSRPSPEGTYVGGILATEAAFDTARLSDGVTNVRIRVDSDVPDAVERVRNTAFRLDPALRVHHFRAVESDEVYENIRSSLFTAAALTMALIAASMLVSQIEQLRERRRLLSVLVAYGTRRSTLAWSVLWQTAIPVVLGMAVAVTGGLALGRLMLRLAGESVADWWVFLPLAGVGAAAIAAVTLLSLPALWRLTRTDGLRTE